MWQSSLTCLHRMAVPNRESSVQDVPCAAPRKPATGHVAMRGLESGKKAIGSSPATLYSTTSAEDRYHLENIKAIAGYRKEGLLWIAQGIVSDLLFIKGDMAPEGRSR